MEQITKGVRELIRVTMRERGIKHRSDRCHVHTVCYAEQALRNVEYEGPIYLTYEEQGIVHAKAFHSTKAVQLSRYEVNSAQSGENITNVRLANMIANYQKRPKDVRFTVEEIRIDVHRPDFCEVLGVFLDKHIKDGNKRPTKWKKRYRDTDQEYVFVPDEQPQKESYRFSLGKMLTTWILRRWFKIDPYDYNYHWRHAMQRHFRCDDEELEQVEHTVKAMQRGKLSEIASDTELILKNDWTEF